MQVARCGYVLGRGFVCNDPREELLCRSLCVAMSWGEVLCVTIRAKGSCAARCMAMSWGDLDGGPLESYGEDPRGEALCR